MDIKKVGFAIVGIAAAILGAGCIDGGPPPLPSAILEPPSGRSTQIPQPERNDNAIFVKLVEEMSYDISRYIDDLGTCISNGDYMDGYTAAVRLESMADVYIEEINECVVTDDMQKAQTLVVASLDEIKLGAVDCQAALPKIGTNVDGDKLLEGREHFEIAVKYLKGIE